MIQWIFDNLIPLIITTLPIIISFIIYFIIKKQIRRFEKKEKLSEATARNLIKVVKYLIILIIFSAIFFQFAESLGLVIALFPLVGGTIICFAAMTTIGNAIAGFIVMISRPFSVGDRILYNTDL
jgi:MscS family membrane protein